MSDFLFTPEGRDYLVSEYKENARSTYDIATEKGTYPNRIRRALKFHKIKVRDKSQAQSAALKSGRHVHPTEGKNRSVAEKLKISKGMAEVWDNMDEKEFKRRQKSAKKQWKEMTIEERKNIQKLAGRGMKKAAEEGSKLEKYLVLGLKTAGFQVEFHKEFLISSEQMHVDIFLPEHKIAIEIDGPTHHLPIWGEEKLKKNQEADQRKTGLLMANHYKVIRIKNLLKNLSEHKMRECLSMVKDTIDLIRDGYLEESCNLEIK